MSMKMAVLIRTFLVKLEQYSKAAITDWEHSALSERAQHVVTTRALKGDRSCRSAVVC